MDAGGVHFKYGTCSYERVPAAHSAGLNTMAWFRGRMGMKEDHLNKYHDVGNEAISMYKTVLMSGVKSMCVNRPDVMVQALEETQRINSYLPRI